MLIINSAQNSLVKNLVRLQKSGARKKQGLFLIDGRREIELALRSGWEIATLVYCPELLDGQAEGAKQLGLATEKIKAVTPAIFKKLCYKENPDGFLAVAQMRRASLADIDLGGNPLVVVLEGVEKPGNLGAILRTAAAAGVAGIIINDSQTDLYNPNVIRASEGQIFAQPLAVATTQETVAWLADHKIKSFAAATGSAKKYTDSNFSGPAAVILGSEADGLSPAWLEAADYRVKIPMRAGIDSLNVSVAAAVIIFEALRQRGSKLVS
ncbi:MAG: RNA methyltransferase [Patescibacteria group bacterium]